MKYAFSAESRSVMKTLHDCIILFVVMHLMVIVFHVTLLEMIV